MDDLLIFDMLRQALWVAVATASPILAVALVVGVVIGLFQALTSVQEMTLTFVPKAAAILATFWVSMGFMSATLGDFFAHRIVPLIAGMLSHGQHLLQHSEPAVRPDEGDADGGEQHRQRLDHRLSARRGDVCRISSPGWGRARIRCRWPRRWCGGSTTPRAS